MTIKYERREKHPQGKKLHSLEISKLKLKGQISDKFCLSLIFFMLTMFSKSVVC